MDRCQFLCHGCSSSVIVHDLDINRAIVPTKTNAKLLVDSDAVHPGSGARQFLQSIARRASQIINLSCRGYHSQLSACRVLKIDKRRDTESFGKFSCFGATKRFDHIVPFIDKRFKGNMLALSRSVADIQILLKRLTMFEEIRKHLDRVQIKAWI